MPDTRPLRLCDVCFELDDHPRHVQAMPPGEGVVPTEEQLNSIEGAPASAIAQMLNPNTIIRHLNCCAAQGCAICQATEELTKGARGQELIDAIAGGALDGFDPDSVTAGASNG